VPSRRRRKCASRTRTAESAPGHCTPSAHPVQTAQRWAPRPARGETERGTAHARERGHLAAAAWCVPMPARGSCGSAVPHTTATAPPARLVAPFGRSFKLAWKGVFKLQKSHELLNGEEEKRKRMAAAARPRTTGSRLRLLAVCAALLAGGALGAGDDASSCARRIRGEGEESTLVILKPDAVREHQLAESEGVETSACVRAAPARSSTAVAGALDLPAGAVSPGGPRTRGRGDLAVRASRPGARRDSGPARCLRCCLGLAPARRRIASCALADAHAVRAFALRTLPRAAGRPRPRRPPRFSRSTTGSTHSASSTRSSSTRWPPER
jgi:hypothetical protein